MKSKTNKRIMYSIRILVYTVYWLNWLMAARVFRHIIRQRVFTYTNGGIVYVRWRVDWKIQQQNVFEFEQKNCVRQGAHVYAYTCETIQW